MLPYMLWRLYYVRIWTAAIPLNIILYRSAGFDLFINVLQWELSYLACETLLGSVFTTFVISVLRIDVSIGFLTA